MTPESRPRRPARDLFLALRPTQWTKNAIVLAAFFFALGDHSLGTLPLGLGVRALGAALLFCLVSSAVYLMNDLGDLAADRLHPLKRLRPIAAGRVPAAAAYRAATSLALLGIVGGWLLEPRVGLALAAYLVMQLAYTVWLKKIALVDLLVIAAGFVLRAMTGALAVRVPISPWLLLCTFLLALFLGLCKRRHEKRLLDDPSATRHRAVLEQYDTALLDPLIAISASCTILAYAVYTLWPDTVAKFHSHGLGFTIPFVVFGIFRYLDLVYRHGRGGRPEKLLLTDAPLLIDIALFALSVLGVIALASTRMP